MDELTCDQHTNDKSETLNKAQLDEMVDQILGGFDIKRMEAIMQLLDWQWVQPDPLEPDAMCLAIPNTERIKLIAHQLLISAIAYGRASSGGLEATYSNGAMELKFVPVSYSTDAQS